MCSSSYPYTEDVEAQERFPRTLSDLKGIRHKETILHKFRLFSLEYLRLRGENYEACIR